jgi:hypothetical protein
MVVSSSFGSGLAGLLTAWAFSAGGRGSGFLGPLCLLRLLAEELMFQLSDSGLEFLDFPLELGFPRFAALELSFPIAGLLSQLKQVQQ